MVNKVAFRKEQLFWLDELDQNYFVKFLIQEEGKGRIADGEPGYQMVQLKDLAGLSQKYEGYNLWRS